MRPEWTCTIPIGHCKCPTGTGTAARAPAAAAMARRPAGRRRGRGGAAQPPQQQRATPGGIGWVSRDPSFTRPSYATNFARPYATEPIPLTGLDQPRPVSGKSFSGKVCEGLRMRSSPKERKGPKRGRPPPGDGGPSRGPHPSKGRPTTVRNLVEGAQGRGSCDTLYGQSTWDLVRAWLFPRRWLGPESRSTPYASREHIGCLPLPEPPLSREHRQQRHSPGTIWQARSRPLRPRPGGTMKHPHACMKQLHLAKCT